MKLPITLLLLFIGGTVSAQRITGLLMGELTRMPLAHATIASGEHMVLSNPYGLFSIDHKAGDSIRISCAGYNYYSFMPKVAGRKDTLVIYLTPVAYSLNEVTIHGKRDFRADSINNRKMFASVFAYKGMTVGDVMIKRDPSFYVYPNYIDAPNNTTQIVGFDVLRLASLLAKKKDKTAKLKKTLLKAEIDNYIDQHFSKEKVSDMTGLKGDSLRLFMEKYRPAPAQLKKMTDYEIMNYIKKRHREFVR